MRFIEWAGLIGIAVTGILFMAMIIPWVFIAIYLDMHELDRDPTKEEWKKGYRRSPWK